MAASNLFSGGFYVSDIYGNRRVDSASQHESAGHLDDDLIPCLVENYHLEVSNPKLPVETGSLRAPGNHANAFVVNGVLDELANAGGIDPVAFRMRLLGTKADFPYKGPYTSYIYNPDRLKGVLMRVAEASGWNEPLPPRCGRGIAAHYTNGSYAAHVIEVEVDAKLGIRFRRVIVAIDCGMVVNGSGVEAQAEGGADRRLSAAMSARSLRKDGRAKQLNFDSYRWIRNEGSTAIEVLLIESREDPAGIGEIPYPSRRASADERPSELRATDPLPASFPAGLYVDP